MLGMKTRKTGVTIDKDLLQKLEEYMFRTGIKSRSRIINRALEHYISERLSLLEDKPSVGVISIIYDHHAGNIEHELTHVQHDHLDIVVSNMHIHLDRERCLELIVVKGDMSRIRSLINRLENIRHIKVLRHDIHHI